MENRNFEKSIFILATTISQKQRNKQIRIK